VLLPVVVVPDDVVSLPDDVVAEPPSPPVLVVPVVPPPQPTAATAIAAKVPTTHRPKKCFDRIAPPTLSFGVTTKSYVGRTSRKRLPTPPFGRRQVQVVLGCDRRFLGFDARRAAQ
jgi:hypothetical protein